MQDYVDELRGIAEASGVPFEVLSRSLHHVQVAFIRLVLTARSHTLSFRRYCVALQTIFLMNLIEEFEDSIPSTFKAHIARRHTLRCSDIVLTAPHLRAVVHNEDGGAGDVNRTAIITAKIGRNPKFVAYTYLGDLPSGAFGFNENGVAFTLNCASLCL